MPEIQSPTPEKLKLLAWVGPDEHTDELGLKQALIQGYGRMPLVARESKPWVVEPDLRAGLQAQANQFGKTIYLVRYVIEEIIDTITPQFKQQ